MSRSGLISPQTLRITSPNPRILFRRFLSVVPTSSRLPYQTPQLYNRTKIQQKHPYSNSPSQTRSFTSTSRKMSTSTTQDPQKDWSASQYLKFGNERTRPVHDLVSQIAPILPSTSSSPLRIYDLGCGPGNSTRVLCSAFPNSRVTGMDSSPDMLRRARTDFSNQPDVDFVPGDVSSFTVSPDTNLIFSNAVFHWLRHPARIPSLARLLQTLSPGGVLAIQMPDNYHEPSHTLMRTVAKLPNQPWSDYFSNTRIGDLTDADRPDLDPIETPAEYYNALLPHAQSINIWRTNYHHVLADAGAIVEWVKGTGLQPYLNRMEGDEGAKKAYLEEYERRLKEEYTELVDGKVLLGYPRLFVVAVRK